MSNRPTPSTEPQASTEPLATFAQVSYAYPHATEWALRNLTLEVTRGEFLGIIGATGAGKTTLCLALNGIVPQFYGGRFHGHLRVLGQDTLEHPVSALALAVGLVFEDPEAQLVTGSVENEVAFALENRCVPREEIRARIPRVLEAVRLDGLERKAPHELSGGQKQRLAIAAALALQPALLVLDEPTSQLDPLGAREVFATLRELNRVAGITIVMAGHAAEELAEYADRLALLDYGTLAALGAPDALYGDVERLEAHGIRPPQVAQTFHLIRKLGGSARLPDAPIPVRLDAGLIALPPAVAAPPPSAAAPSANGLPLLACTDLHYTYPDGTAALRGITLRIQAGEYVLLAGPNGAGKSTLVRHFLRLLRPTRGAVTMDGRDTRVLRMSELAQRIGYVAQNPDHQIFNPTVEAEVAFALKNLGYARGEVQARVDESLAALGLLEVRSRHPLSLPRGERARVVIAATLALRPAVLIFDEPTSGQDYAGARRILDLTRALHAQGQTILVITHHLYLMAEYAQRMVVLCAGQVRLDAPLRAAYHAEAALREAQLAPPQAVSLAQALGQPLLTPAEVAACVCGVAPGGEPWLR